jgi:hypothetical protein
MRSVLATAVTWLHRMARISLLNADPGQGRPSLLGEQQWTDTRQSLTMG